MVGADITFAYRPLRNNQFQSVTWGTEVLHSDNRYDVTSSDGNLSTQTVGSYGLYSYLAYKFHRQWTTGVVFDWVENLENNQAKTSAYSAYVTWALSHWNQLRLQYTHTNNNAATGLQPNDAVYLQWSWIIGSHAHGWQER
jgi:outer membrane protein assembly factor BamA